MGWSGMEIKLCFLPKCLESVTGVVLLERQEATSHLTDDILSCLQLNSGTMQTLALWMLPLLCKFSLAGRSAF